jgi:hypothetical protein
MTTVLYRNTKPILPMLSHAGQKPLKPDEQDTGTTSRSKDGKVENQGKSQESVVERNCRNLIQKTQRWHQDPDDLSLSPKAKLRTRAVKKPQAVCLLGNPLEILEIEHEERSTVLHLDVNNVRNVMILSIPPMDTGASAATS